MNNKILVVVAHPDDEVLGCGATIAKYAKEGSKISCLFLGRGKASRHVKEGESLKKEQSIIEEEARKAAAILGISEIFFEDFPDQKYDTVPLLDITKAIEKIKERVKPDTIFTHHYSDLNLDHCIALRAVLTACRPGKEETVKKIYSFGTSFSTMWRVVPFSPNVFVDVKDTFSKKIEAIKAYQSEARSYPHLRSSESIEFIARNWGVTVSKELVEPFELVREIE